jgi:hypothetical protein
MTYLAIRCAGGGHHHEDHHEDHHIYLTSKSLNERIKKPTKEELDQELPKKAIFNQRLMRYIRTKWNVTKDDVL